MLRFVAAKTKVAPLQVQTIPRLELLSALLLSRLMVSVCNSLLHVVNNITMKCYTDSQVALYWIRGKDKEWKPFVQNRVNEIRRNVHPDLWNHCPGVSNPADLPSRGISVVELSTSLLWRTGPDWLTTDVPCQSDIEAATMPEQCSQELNANCRSSHNLVTIERHSIGSLMNCENFSVWTKLLRVTAYVLRAITQFKGKKSRPSLGVLTPLEISAAEILWITHTQEDLTQQKNFHLLTRELGLFLDDKGLWRCAGRLQNVELPYSSKHPVLLPHGHPVSAIIVRDAHRRVCHNGVKETLTEVRSKYWIIRGRSFTKATVHKCTVCKRYEGAPLNGPPPPPLPEFRVKDDPAFSYTGVDFAGPLVVRGGVSNASSKVWVCLFTCLVTRAIHLDVVDDLSTGAFLRCLKRFAARRGLPLRFLSDNGKTFKAAARFLEGILKDNAIIDHLALRGSQWIFNVERAPWWGGVFERMVRSTKRCLRKIVGRAHFTRDELLTAVVEIEGVINSRPLSYVSSSDLDEPLTPSHLIVGRRLLNLPDHTGYVGDPDDEEFEVDATHLQRRIKHLSGVLGHFWKRWRAEYLIELRDVHRYSAKNTPHTSHVSQGDIVIVHDDSLPRGLWKLGRIQQLFTGQDGLPRSALVKVAVRGNEHTLLKRPLQLLYPLEVAGAESNEDRTEEVQTLEQEDTLTPSEIPIPRKKQERRAAMRAAQKIRAWAQQLGDED